MSVPKFDIYNENHIAIKKFIDRDLPELFFSKEDGIFRISYTMTHSAMLFLYPDNNIRICFQHDPNRSTWLNDKPVCDKLKKLIIKAKLKGLYEER
jgi:hypothetical protein